jgi:hypothetical protein
VKDFDLRLILELYLEDKEMIGKFKMAAGDVITIRKQVMEHMYIPTRIKRELVWITTGRAKLMGLLEESRWPFILE